MAYDSVEGMHSRLARSLARWVIKKNVGKMEDYGLPKPDHEALETHPSVSGEFLTRVGCGDIHVKGALECLDGEEVVFADDSHEPIDLIVWATGDKVSFTFFEDPELRPKDNRFPLFKRIMNPGYDSLFFMALAQPLPTLMNFAEQQSKLVAAYLAGRYAPPSEDAAGKKIAVDEKLYLSHFSDSPRHTMQVDFTIDVDDLLEEIARGEKRAKQPDANVFRSPRAALQAGVL